MIHPRSTSNSLQTEPSTSNQTLHFTPETEILQQPSSSTSAKRKKSLAFRAPSRSTSSIHESEPRVLLEKGWRSSALKSKIKPPKESVEVKAKWKAAPVLPRIRPLRNVVAPKRGVVCVLDKSDGESDSSEDEDKERSDRRLAWLTSDVKQSLYDQLNLIHYQLEVELGSKPFKSVDELISLLPRNGGSGIIQLSDETSDSDSDSSEDELTNPKNRVGISSRKKSNQSSAERKNGRSGSILRERNGSHSKLRRGDDKRSNRNSTSRSMKDKTLDRTKSNSNHYLQAEYSGTDSEGANSSSSNPRRSSRSPRKRYLNLESPKPLTEQALSFMQSSNHQTESFGENDITRADISSSDITFYSRNESQMQVDADTPTSTDPNPNLSNLSFSFGKGGVNLLNPGPLPVPSSSNSLFNSKTFNSSTTTSTSQIYTAREVREMAIKDGSGYVPSSSRYSDLEEKFGFQDDDDQDGMQFGEVAFKNGAGSSYQPLQQPSNSVKPVPASSSSLTSCSTSSHKRKRSLEDSKHQQVPLSDRIPALKTVDWVVDRWLEREIELLDKRREKELERIEKEVEISVQMETATWENLRLQEYRESLFVAYQKLFLACSHKTKDPTFFDKEEVRLLKMILRDSYSSRSVDYPNISVNRTSTALIGEVDMELEGKRNSARKESLRVDGERSWGGVRLVADKGMGIDFRKDEVEVDLKAMRGGHLVVEEINEGRGKEKRKDQDQDQELSMSMKMSEKRENRC